MKKILITLLSWIGFVSVFANGPCKKIVTAPNCGSGTTQTCNKQADTSVPLICGVSYVKLNAAWSTATKFPQKDCSAATDPNSECWYINIHCEGYEEGICEQYVVRECWISYHEGVAYIVEVGTEGGQKWNIYNVNPVRTVGPVFRGSGRDAHN